MVLKQNQLLRAGLRWESERKAFQERAPPCAGTGAGGRRHISKRRQLKNQTVEVFDVNLVVMTYML